MWILVTIWHFMCAGPGQSIINAHAGTSETYTECDRQLVKWLQASSAYAFRNHIGMMVWTGRCLPPNQVASFVAEAIEIDQQTGNCH